MKYYILDENHQVVEADMFIANAWLSSNDRKRVALDEIGEFVVSTVFLFFDHSFHNDGPPILFETMIFSDNNMKLEGYCERYCTWVEAMEGHQRAIEIAKGYNHGNA